MIWSHLRILRGKARAVIHTGCLWNDVSQKVSNYFICYLMNKYELYLTFSIIIISPAPDRDWDGAAACHTKPLTARASSARDQFFEMGLFRDRRSNIPKRLSADNDRYPINRSTPTFCSTFGTEYWVSPLRFLRDLFIEVFSDKIAHHCLSCCKMT